jgi:UDP-4-amino-4,6-dideoxy-N-acetyl-beta-L-altrosamine N-acetyltransferase
MLSGNKIRLRPFEKSDLEKCKQWVNDPEIATLIKRVLPVSMHEHIKWYEKVITDRTKVTFALETTEKEQYIGNLGLEYIDWTSRKARFWIYLDKAQWDKGYGKEAVSLLLNYSFYSLNLNKIYLDVGSFNKRAIKVYESIGFSTEGVLRQDFYTNGTYVDVLRMAILKRDFSSK